MESKVLDCDWAWVVEDGQLQKEKDTYTVEIYSNPRRSLGKVHPKKVNGHEKKEMNTCVSEATRSDVVKVKGIRLHN